MGWRKNRVGSTRRGAFFCANLLASCPPPRSFRTDLEGESERMKGADSRAGGTIVKMKEGPERSRCL